MHTPLFGPGGAALPGLALILLALILLAVGLRALARRGRAPALADGAATPSAAEIVAALDAVPPLQRDRAARAYRGRPVRWRVTYDAAFGDGPTTLRVMCLAGGPGDSWPWVTFDVGRWRYPPLKALAKNAPVWVSGHIARVKPDEIVLKGAALEFPDA